jgi:hypothetical protein
MSVHDDFFLPGDQDPIPHQGAGEAAADFQVFGGNSLAGDQQGSLVGSGRNLGGGYLPLTKDMCHYKCQLHLPHQWLKQQVATLEQLASLRLK